MHRKTLVGLLSLVLICGLAMGLANSQSFGNRVGGADTINDTVSVGFDGTRFFYCWLDDSASGVGYLTTYRINSGTATVVETCSYHIRPGKDFFSPAITDSFMFIKADSSDIFNYLMAR